MPQWHMMGGMVGACSCDWGCPCNFDARPTNGWCQGGYTWQIQEGGFGDVDLAGLAFSWYGKAPGPLHEGNVVAQPIIEERASQAQRQALQTLLGGTAGGPFAIFASVTVQAHDPVFAPYAIKLDGIRSHVRAGDFLEVGLTRVNNPVTGEEEELYLDKPTGFTALKSELGRSLVCRVNLPAIQYDHSGKYAEYAEYAYRGEA